MRRSFATPVFAGNLIPVVSLDEIIDHLDAEGGPIPFDLTDPGPRPDERAECREIVDALVAFSQTLSDRDREVFRRAFLEEETQTVAADMGVSKMAISKAIARIQKKARTALAPCEFLVLGTERGVAAARVPAAKTRGLLHGGENRCRKRKEK